MEKEIEASNSLKSNIKANPILIVALEGLVSDLNSDISFAVIDANALLYLSRISMYLSYAFGSFLRNPGNGNIPLFMKSNSSFVCFGFGLIGFEIVGEIDFAKAANLALSANGILYY